MSEIERESIEFDVVIVGPGSAGLEAAIRLKQVNPELGLPRYVRNLGLPTMEARRQLERNIFYISTCKSSNNTM